MSLIKKLLLWLFLWPVLIFYYPLRWLWRKLFRRTVAQRGHYWVDVVGESSYYDNFRKICGQHTQSINMETIAAIVLEKENRFDPGNAVRVEIKGYTVGYLPRESARVFSQMMKKAKTSQVTGIHARIRGGWKNKNSVGNYGVKLRIDK